MLAANYALDDSNERDAVDPIFCNKDEASSSYPRCSRRHWSGLYHSIPLGSSYLYKQQVFLTRLWASIIASPIATLLNACNSVIYSLQAAPTYALQLQPYQLSRVQCKTSTFQLGLSVGSIELLQTSILICLLFKVGDSILLHPVWTSINILYDFWGMTREL